MLCLPLLQCSFALPWWMIIFWDFIQLTALMWHHKIWLNLYLRSFEKQLIALCQTIVPIEEVIREFHCSLKCCCFYYNVPSFCFIFYLFIFIIYFFSGSNEVLFARDNLWTRGQLPAQYCSKNQRQNVSFTSEYALVWRSNRPAFLALLLIYRGSQTSDMYQEILYSIAGWE